MSPTSIQPHEFAHLHVHTELGSLLDGLSRISAKPDGTGLKGTVVERAAQLGQTALAITDHGTMHGAVRFYKACREAGIKPIIGMEAYVTPHTSIAWRPEKVAKGDKREREGLHHLTLLAMNNEGYEHLLELASIAATEGMYYKPRIDKELLERLNGGLIALSGCMSGEVSRALRNDDVGGALKAADWYRQVFGDRYYLEVHHHGMLEVNEEELLGGLVGVSRTLGIPLVAANDSHYTRREDAELHDILLCIQTNKRVTDTDRTLKMENDEFFLKSASEMVLTTLPMDAILRTTEVADRCNVELELGKARFPVPANCLTVVGGTEPGEASEFEYLRHKAHEGLEARYEGVDPERYEPRDLIDRLNYELDVIKQTGYVRYFLIVADLVRWAHSAGIPTSARGSAAGSLVAYCLGITPVDPIKYRLVFERFLNPGRTPDIDLDFADTRRHEVMRYAAEAYGADRVAQIVTFSRIGGRSAIRDVGRALAAPYDLCDKLAKLVPFDPTPGAVGRIRDAVFGDEETNPPKVAVPELAAAYETDTTTVAGRPMTGCRRILDVAMALEGISRQTNTHAGGMVLSDRPIVKTGAIMRGKTDTILNLIQLEMHDCETAGLVKFDLLGLATLSIVERTLRFIREGRGIAVDIGAIPLTDGLTLEAVTAGETAGVFQLESGPMRRHLARLEPSSEEELMAMVALYRPGPKPFIPNYIAGKHGEAEEISWGHPIVDEVLAPTYGVIVYQEAIMEFAKTLCGMSLYEADQFLYAIRKKVKSRLAEYEPKWFEGAASRGVPRDVAQKVWDAIQPFAGYGFNIAHAACYGMLAYVTAYLKAHFPAEFMAAFLTTEASGQEAGKKVPAAMFEARRIDVAVYGPDINRSSAGFSVESGVGVRFGLAAVKYVGEAAVAAIMEAREAAGPFCSFDDFRERVPKRACNSKTVDYLIKAGAFDTLIPDRQEWPASEKLAAEREALGMPVSDHPIAPYTDGLNNAATVSAASLGDHDEDDWIDMGGAVTEVKEIPTKKGAKMAKVTLEDYTGQFPVTLFTKAWANYQDVVKVGQVLVVHGRVNRWDDQPQLIGHEVRVLEPDKEGENE